VVALFVAFVVVPIVEIFVIVKVGEAIGALNTIGLLLLFSIFGAWLAKHEGLFVLTRIRDQVDAGRMPTNDLIDGGLILAGGLLLLVPGFVSDAIGLLLLFPPTRAGARVLVRHRLQIQVATGPHRYNGPDDVIDV
jgi:UPF0716 protein FxsA